MVEAINDKVLEEKQASKVDVKAIEIKEQIEKIVKIIMEGVGDDNFKNKLVKLEDEKIFLREKLDQLKDTMRNDKLRVVTKEEVMKLVAKVKSYVLTRSILQCKKFIVKH